MSGHSRSLGSASGPQSDVPVTGLHPGRGTTSGFQPLAGRASENQTSRQRCDGGTCRLGGRCSSSLASCKPRQGSVCVYILTPVDYCSSPAPALPSLWGDEGVEPFSDELADARVQARDG